MVEAMRKNYFPSVDDGGRSNMSNHPPVHPDWVTEQDVTRRTQNWKESLLSKVRGQLEEWGDWADKVGFKIKEVQIQFKSPIDSLFKFEPLNLMWVRFNTYDAITKKPAMRTVRFGPNTARLMALVKVPKGESFDLFLLARRKYQFASKELFTELTRGFDPKKEKGWGLFERDFPGLKGHKSVVSIKEKQMGNVFFENNTEMANIESEHLIVVEMLEGTTLEQIQSILIDAKLQKVYGEMSGYGQEDLESEPVVMPVIEAAKLLNGHYEGKNIPLALYGEQNSRGIWGTFLALHGKQFPELLPEQEEMI